MSDLERLLDQTREALLAGDLLRLAQIAGEVAGADPPTDPQVAERSRALAEQNLALLGAALKGVQAARRRAGELAEPARFSTYDAQGRRDALGGGPMASKRL